ncbi:MAG: efflux RND transporter periplasmic adaptor subunit [Pseudomonadota bacterium]|jgi:RND family efflux transporter MFP subunit
MKTPSPSTRPIHALAALALAVPLLAGCSDRQEQALAVRPVETVVVKTGAAAGMSGFAGEVRARHEADLAFRIGGKVTERHVDVGVAVKKGQVLARLDPRDAALAAQAARAQVAAAEADHALAQAELERYRRLYQQRFVSRAVLDARETAYQAARARLDQARAQAAVSGNQAAYTELRAEGDGIITAVNVEAGQVVAAGQPVMRLARPEEKEVLIHVPESRIGEVRNTGQAVVTLWAQAGRRYAGRVREIAPAADAATRTFAVRVAIVDADQDVRLGMTAHVLFGAGWEAGAALLPLTAVVQKDGKPVVWLVDPASRQVTPRPVEVAAWREDGAVVSAGVKDGDLVVVRGAHKLLPGQAVRLYEAAGTLAADQPAGAAK